MKFDTTKNYADAESCIYYCSLLLLVAQLLRDSILIANDVRNLEGVFVINSVSRFAIKKFVTCYDNSTLFATFLVMLFHNKILRKRNNITFIPLY